MRISGLLLVVGLIGVAAFAAEPAPLKSVTVAQLEQTLAIPHRSDGEAMRVLTRLQLTERLSAERLARLSGALPGPRSREALLVLADLAGFLDLPAGDVPAIARPDAAAQKLILTRAIDHVAEATRRLPDLLATRRMTRYEDLKVVRGTTKPVRVRSIAFRRLEDSTATVLFREGSEVVQLASGAMPEDNGLVDRGVFGVLLAVVTSDIRSGRIGFDHWEKVVGDSPGLAVFRFAVAESQSHYSVDFCCYQTDDGWLRRYEATPGYHGELAIDAESGAIRRVLLKTDLKASATLHVERETESPLERADVLVEYGPVVIGGRTYVCPLRSVSVMTSYTVGGHGVPSPVIYVDSQGRVRAPKPQSAERVEHSRVTALNHYEFLDHHLFRGDLRIVPESTKAVPH